MPSSSLSTFDIVIAVDAFNGFGKDGALPWSKTPEGKLDMAHFRSTTANSVVVMGKRTWLSIPQAFRPLKGRHNVVVSRELAPLNTEKTGGIDDVIYVTSLNAALKYGKTTGLKVFVIGGLELLKEALYHPLLREMYMTVFDYQYNCDIYLPMFPSALYLYDRKRLSEKVEVQYYKYRNFEEENYIALVHEVINKGEVHDNRTADKTYMLANQSLSFSLYDEHNLKMIWPLMSHRHISPLIVFHELIWFLKGSVDITYLLQNNVNIWNDNSTREFLDSRSLNHYRAGEVGPVYGFQWRHFGAQYNGPDCSYSGKGVDQIHKLIEDIKNNPTSRRHLVSAWNPAQLNMMALPPCHYSFQVLVENGRLDLIANMRSADLIVGVPYNIASYSLLAHLIARSTGLTARTLYLNMADCHVYLSHVEKFAEIPRNVSLPFPTFSINENKKNDMVAPEEHFHLDMFTNEQLLYTDIAIDNYYPVGRKLFKMIV